MARSRKADPDSLQFSHFRFPTYLEVAASRRVVKYSILSSHHCEMPSNEIAGEINQTSKFREAVEPIFTPELRA